MLPDEDLMAGIEMQGFDPEPEPDAKSDEKKEKAKKPADSDPEPDPEPESDDSNVAASEEPGEEEDEPEEKPKKRPKKTASERIREQNKTINRLEEKIADLETRLTTEKPTDKLPDERKAPDPTDTEKYPLGVLDDKYVEDKIAFEVDSQVARTITAALQRQEQADQEAEAERLVTEARAKADVMTAKGIELYDDFEEVVVEPGLRGDWKLEQPTFEAAAEAEHGVQILYELASDPQEAARVAGLSPFAQIKFVLDRNAEIVADKPKARHKPGAGEPAQNQPRGANSKTAIREDTDNLDDFEKLWEQNEKKRRS